MVVRSKFEGNALPIRKSVFAARVNVPPTALRAAENVPRSNVPAATVRSPLSTRLPASRAVLADLLIVRLLKVVEAIIWELVPVNTTVPAPGVKVFFFNHTATTE